MLLSVSTWKETAIALEVATSRVAVPRVVAFGVVVYGVAKFRFVAYGVATT
jgi:ABC-type sulfate transport system permease subunit